MTTVLLVEDKHDTYVIENERGVEYAALDLLTKRVEDGFWYSHEDAGRAQAIIDTEDAKGALAFLLDRRDAEYEWVEVQETR